MEPIPDNRMMELSAEDLAKEKLLRDELLRKLEQMFHGESSGHDITHLVRTYNLANHLQMREGGDREVVLIASLVHDIHRLVEKESGQFCSPSDSLGRVKELLSGTGLSLEKIDKILHCIEHHEEYGFSEKGKTVEDVETLILQDADNLDAIGAIGVARTLSFGAAHNVPLWRPDIPVGRQHFDESEKDSSTIHHFYSKLLRLKDNMNTIAGKEMAKERDAFMRQFLDHFFKEWSGEI